MKIICKYCGNRTYIERIEGRDACAHCGAGIKEDVVKDVVGRKKTYEEIMVGNLASAVKETTGVLLKSSLKTIETTTQKKKKKPSVVDNDKSYQRTKTYKQSWGGFNRPKLLAVGMIFISMMFVTTLTQPASMWAYTDNSDNPIGFNESVITEIGIIIRLVNVSNGDMLNSAGMVEIHNPSGEMGGQLLAFEYYSTTMVVFSGLLEIGKAYEMWYYPNVGDYESVYKTAFRCSPDEIYNFTFGF